VSVCIVLASYQIDKVVGGGLLVFGICAFCGLRLLYRGICGDIFDSSGTQMAGREWFIVGGVLLIVPFVMYLFLLWQESA
jgi:hypothetical protein